MGSEDESSSDKEQGEKILYFYPLETPLNKQVILLFSLSLSLAFLSFDSLLFSFSLSSFPSFSIPSYLK